MFPSIFTPIYTLIYSIHINIRVNSHINIHTAIFTSIYTIHINIHINKQNKPSGLKRKQYLRENQPQQWIKDLWKDYDIQLALLNQTAHLFLHFTINAEHSVQSGWARLQYRTGSNLSSTQGIQCVASLTEHVHVSFHLPLRTVWVMPCCLLTIILTCFSGLASFTF